MYGVDSAVMPAVMSALMSALMSAGTHVGAFSNARSAWRMWGNASGYRSVHHTLKATITPGQKEWQP